MAYLAYHPSWVLEVYPSCGLSTISSRSSALVAVGRSMGGICLDQSAARIGYDPLQPTSALCGDSAVQGQGGGAQMWSGAVHWVHRPWGFLDGTGQGQPPLVFCPGPTLPELESSLRWLLLVLGLEISKQSQAVSLGC